MAVEPDRDALADRDATLGSRPRPGTRASMPRWFLNQTSAVSGEPSLRGDWMIRLPSSTPPGGMSRPSSAGETRHQPVPHGAGNSIA
jgi:hypothetical protein